MAFTTATISITSNNKDSYYTSSCDRKSSVTVIATATATATATLVTTTRNKPAAPARFGKSMPYHLLSRPFTTTSSSSRSSSRSSSSSTTKDIPSTITRINTYNNKKEDSIQVQQSILVSKAGENRDESCPLCKKYSQGPCGKLFQQWIECIDANAKANANEGNGDGNGDGNGNGDESKTDCVCDSLVAPLDKCLKEHQEYYDKISIYDDDNDNDQQAIDKWKDFILAIEQDDGIQFEPCSQSQHPPEMEMQLRPKSNMGAAMFHPEMRNGHGDQGQGQGRVLLLAYIKDQNGALLGAGSVEDLFPFQDQYVLRFGVTDTCKDITAHALYGYKDGANADADADADADGSHESLTIYTKTQRVPPS